MDVFPSRTTLYRRTACAVILLALAFMGLWKMAAQVSRGAKANKGPRALGLLVLPANGKPHLIPVAIMVDGQFYDASAYKASPVPMALWSEVVYEAEKTGVSQGLFTVVDALQNKQTNEWMAEGKWQTAEALAAAALKHPASPSKPRGLDDESGPPVLRHAGANKPVAPEPAAAPTGTSPTTPAPTGSPQVPATQASAPPAAPPASGSGSTTQTTAASSAAASPAAAPAPVASAASGTPQSTAEPEDPNRPMLKRGQQPPRPAQVESSGSQSSGKAAAASGKAAASSSSSASAQTSQVQLIPAISDADGPDPRSYVFVLKPGEEEEFRKKMLVVATDEIRAHEKQLSGANGAPEHPASHGKAAAAKVPQPDFKDVQLRVFDLTNSNDATLVMAAKAESVQRTSANQTAAREYFVTVVAREDINGDLHKVFSSVTDAQDLDEPRWELIDAVDANGDGSGELLFRKRSDAGSAFAIYRVIGDQLYPLFEGTPGE